MGRKPFFNIPAGMEKKYIGTQELPEDSVKSGAKILQGDFRPDFVIHETDN